MGASHSVDALSTRKNLTVAYCRLLSMYWLDTYIERKRFFFCGSWSTYGCSAVYCNPFLWYWQPPSKKHTYTFGLLLVKHGEDAVECYVLGYPLTTGVRMGLSHSLSKNPQLYRQCDKIFPRLSTRRVHSHCVCYVVQRPENSMASKLDYFKYFLQRLMLLLGHQVTKLSHK